MSQAVCHQSEKMVVGGSNVWRVRRVQRFQACLNRSYDMWPSIVVLEDNFVVSFLVLWPCLLQCWDQTHQLRLIPIPYHGFTRFQQLIIDHTELVPPNSEPDLGIVKIRSARRRGSMTRHFPRFPALGIIVVDPFFIAGHNAL